MKTPLTVEQHLAAVSYGEDTVYVPTDFAADFVTFIKLVNGTEGESHLTPVVHYKMLDTIVGKKSKIINMCHRGMAKALSLDSQIITPKGNISVENISVGDELFTRNGDITTVTHKSEIFNKKMYELKLVDGRKLKLSEDHINIVLKRTQSRTKPTYMKEHNLTTSELLEKGVSYSRKVCGRNPSGKESKWFVPTAGAVEYLGINSPIDPYTIGAILGDGSIDKECGFTRLHTHADDLEHFLSTIEGACRNSVRSDTRRESTKRFSLKGIGPKVKEFIGTENVYGKRVPQKLLWSSQEQRLAVLRGLMDTDGTIHCNNQSSFTSVSKGLANDVMWLVRSLGGESKVTKNTWEGRVSYRVRVRMPVNPFLLERKAAKWSPNVIGHTAIESILEIESEPSQCIAVADESHSFLVNSFMVTHNTTVMGEYLFLYLAVFGSIPGFGKVSLAIYVSDSIENGVKNMRKNLEFRWENSEFLQAQLPKSGVRFTDVRWEFNNVDGKRFIVKGYGAKTGVRGAKEMGVRPQLAVLDDLVSDEDARSATVIDAIEATVNKAVNFALDPDRNKTIWSGTPFNAKDPLYKAVESGAWITNVFPVCEKFPVDEAEFRGSWPDRFPYSYVKEQFEFAVQQGKPADFNQELMLRIMSDEDRMVQDSDIKWFKSSPVMRSKDQYNFYITTDFATSEKTAADYSAISVWAYTNNGDWLLIDGVCKRQLMDANINDLFRLVQIYNPLSVGVEVSGQQGGFVSWIQSEMGTRGIWFNLASDSNSGGAGIRPNGDKMKRFMTILPLFKAGKIYLPEDKKNTTMVREAVEELSLASASGFKSKHDDWIDTVSMLSVMKAYKPAGTQEYVEKDGMWEIDEEDESCGMSSYLA